MIKKPKIKLFYKFGIIMVLLATIPVAVVSWRTYSINQNGMQSVILELHTKMVTSLADKINTHIQQIDRQIQFIMRNLTTPGRDEIFLSLVDSNPDYLSISIVKKDGKEQKKYLVGEGKLQDISSNPTFKQFWEYQKIKKNNNKSAISPVYFRDEKPTIDIFYPVNDNFTLYIVLNLTNIWDEVIRMGSGKTGRTFLVDSEGRIIAHPNEELAFNKKDVSNLPIVEAVLRENSVGSSEYINEAGATLVGAYAPVTNLKWGVITEQNKSEAFLSVYKMRKQAVLFTVLSILLASLIAFMLARNLTQPISNLIQAAKRVANSDFSAKVQVATADEMMDLVETFNFMTGKLKEYSDIQLDKIIEEKTKTEAIIFSIDDGLIMTDHQGHIQLINSQAMNLFNINKDEVKALQHKSILDIIHDDKISDQVREVLNNPHEEFFKEIYITRETANQFYKTSASKVTSLKGEDLGIVTVFHNITLEKELDQIKNDFLHSITHDLRNPMTSIRGFVKFLIDGIGGPINEQQSKMLQTVDRASARLLNMINDILDIAKIESKKFEIELVPLDIKELALHAQEIYRPQIEKKNIDFQLDFPENYPTIMADHNLIDRVIQNLTSNAIKFSPETEGKITIKLMDEEKHLIVSVIDNGPGIPKEYLDKIFDKFQQVQGQRKGGTGLGLTICKFILEAHKGNIWAESESENGSRFIFYISKNLTKDEKGRIVT
ncbi:MAG: ATP-binding protein [bacterium]